MMGLFNRKPKDDTRDEAREALAEATSELAEVKERWPEVRKEGAWHRWRRDENHFADDLAKLMKGT